MSQLNTREYLERFENADVSRENLLRTQRIRAGLSGELLTTQTKRLKKRLKSGSSFKKGRRGRKAEPSTGEERQKTPLEVELEREKQIKELQREERKLTQQDRFLQLEDFKQQREFVANERRIRADLIRAQAGLQQSEIQRQTDFISGQNRILADQQIAVAGLQQSELQRQTDFIAAENRRLAEQQISQAEIASQQQIAQAERTQRGQLAGRERAQQQRQFEARQDLENRRLQIQGDEIAANFDTNKKQRRLRYAELDAERARYDRDVRRAEIQRDVDISRQERELAAVQERVARDDAFRHRQLQEQNRLVLEGLARLGKDNSLSHEREVLRIQNQRAVDEERAISDREKEKTLQQGLNLLRHNQPPQQVGTGSVEVVEEPSGVPQAHRATRARSPSPRRSPSPTREPESLLSIDTDSSSLAESEQHPSRRKRAISKAAVREEQLEGGGLRSPSPRPSRRVNIEEATTSGRTVQKPKRFEGGATEAELAAAGGIPGQTPKSKPEPEPEVSVEFRAADLTKSQVARDLPFAGPKLELNLQQPEAIKDEPTERPVFQDVPPAIRGEIGETEEEIAQAEADVELFGRKPGV
jgi:hypothetical protein